MKKLFDRNKTTGAEGPPQGAAAPQTQEPTSPAPKPPPELPLFFMLSHLDEDGPVRLDGTKLGMCEVMGLELDEPKLGAFAWALNACDFPVQLLIRQHAPRLDGLRERLAEAQPGNLPPQTEAASESLRRLLTELEARDGILDRRFYAITEFGRFDELRGLLARAGLSVHPLSGRRLRMLMLAAALGGTPAEMDEETPVEMEMRRREVRVGDRLVRSLHLGKWPRSLAPGFLQNLMAAGAPMDLSIHLGSIPAEQAARTLEWQKVRFESAQSLSFKRGRTMSPEAEIALEDVTRLRDEVQRGRERLFHASLSITLHAKDEASLKEMTQRARGHFAATLGKLDPLGFRQREGILSTLPLGLNAVAEWRTLDTSSLARLFPFSPPDLDTRRGTLYGIDMRACSPVVYDPWDGSHLNANTAVLARSGSGKSFATKLGMLRGLCRGVTAYVIDPEGEYADMARAAGGRVLSPGVPGQGMNPFVIERGDSEELLQRIGSLRRLIEVMVGESLGAERRAALDHALAGYYAQPRERTGFRDFYEYLQGDEAGGGDMAKLLRPFATGSLRYLLSDEGDDLLHNEALITVFDLRLLEPELRPAAAMVCKVSRIAFDGELQVVAVLPATDDQKKGRERASKLLEPVAAAYRHYDHAAGARFKVSRVHPVVPDPSTLHPSGPGLFGKRSVLGVREAAALWHPPGARDETPLVARSGARVLMPSSREVRRGAQVGQTTAGRPRTIHFPDDLLRRHHLYVARTRMGKSTLMHHIVVHKMMEKADGRDSDAIIVVDPHADLVSGLLRQVPESLIDRVRLIDLADERGAPGVNLLDTRIFSDRDRTADSVVRIAKGLWDQWGPRMQSILEQSVKTLHEANEHPSTADDEQLTILDALTLLADDKFKNGVLTRVSDPYLLQWWGRDFKGWRGETKADALAPVQTRLSYYASSKRARAILGQPRSTIDMRRVIRDGGILLVSTAQGTAGKDVAALVGASLLNLVDAVIREQGSLPIEQRRGALVVVDEMQSMPGVDYESMLSELGKFGASFVLATQSLGKLDDLSRTMRDTLLANVGCLAVFQVAGNDARQMVWELGKDRVSEEDIVSLPVHQCYVRATVGTERMPTFSMMVSKPEHGDPAVAERIKAKAASYLTTEEEIAAQQAEGRRRAEEFRKAVKDIREGNEPSTNEQKDAPKDLERGDQRSKHFQPPTGRSGQDADDGEAEE